MKKIVLLAHDPGGYDVVKPVYEELLQNGCEVIFYCVGPASKLDEEFATTKDAVFQQVDCLLKTQQLAALVTGTSWGDDFELQLLAKANLNNIVTIAILDYWSNYKSRFAYAGGYVYPKYYLVMDELARKEALDEGVPEDIIQVMGHPGLQKYLDIKVENTKGNTLETKNCLLLSQPLSLLYGDTLGYTEDVFLQDCIEVLKALGIQFAIKFHPKDREEIKDKYSFYQVQGNLEELLNNYDVVIGMSSMALLHAHLFGKHIISYQPNLLKTDDCITNKLGITKLITTKLVLEDILANEQYKKTTNVNNMGKNAKEKIVQFIIDKSGRR